MVSGAGVGAVEVDATGCCGTGVATTMGTITGVFGGSGGLVL